MHIVAFFLFCSKEGLGSQTSFVEEFLKHHFLSSPPLKHIAGMAEIAYWSSFHLSVPSLLVVGEKGRGIALGPLTSMALWLAPWFQPLYISLLCSCGGFHRTQLWLSWFFSNSFLPSRTNSNIYCLAEKALRLGPLAFLCSLTLPHSFAVMQVMKCWRVYRWAEEQSLQMPCPCCPFICPVLPCSLQQLPQASGWSSGFSLGSFPVSLQSTFCHLLMNY